MADMEYKHEQTKFIKYKSTEQLRAWGSQVAKHFNWPD